MGSRADANDLYIPGAESPGDTSRVPDAALALRAAGGDQAAFGTLLARHQPALLRLCARLVHDATLAEDCAQDAALLALLCLRRLRSPEHFGAWLRGIGIRVCRRELRRRTEDLRHAAHDLAIQGTETALIDGASGDESLLLAELGRNLRSAVQELPAGQREAVRRFYLAGQSYEEAAAALGIPVGALKTRLHKARAGMRERLRVPPLPSASERTAALARAGPQVVAAHEAAHAVMGWMHGIHISRISIAPVSGVELTAINANLAAKPKTPDFGAPARDALLGVLAGEAANLRQRSRYAARFGASDRAAAASIARQLADGDEVEAALIVDQSWMAARDRLSDQVTWSLVQRVAAVLAERRTLDGDEFRRLVSK